MAFTRDSMRWPGILCGAVDKSADCIRFGLESGHVGYETLQGLHV